MDDPPARLGSSRSGASRPGAFPPGSPRRWSVAVPAAGLLSIGLAVVVGVADLADRMSPASVALDLLVGLAFIAGAAAAPGSRRARALFGAVGVAWFLGSLAPVALLAYAGVLAIALETFPGGRPASAWHWLLAGVSLLAIAIQPVDAVLAGLFAVVALTTGAALRGERAARRFATAAGSSLALLFGAYALAQQQPGALDQALWLLAHQVVLIGVAVGFPVAARAVVRERAMLADRLLAGDQPAGLAGLAALLADTLGDDGLRVLRWDVGAGAYVGVDDRPATIDDAQSLLMIDDGGGRLAAVAHGDVAAIRDPVISLAVAEAVRLTALNERWQMALQARVAELEAARGRLVAATDRQRASTAARLREDVVRPIETAIAALGDVDAAGVGPEARQAMAVAGEELAASVDQITALTAGVPPARLGDGGLRAAIGRLAERCPIPVALDLATDASADAERETVLFYVCSEALANAIKHARAGRIRIGLRRERGSLVLIVADDGIGGASTLGFGLRGLKDRLAAYGGRLRVDSPPGAGTTITARLGP